jgi:arylsulfatase A-like enzyme
MNLRPLLRLLALGTLLAATFPVLASAGQERPNVVILLADDLGYGDLGCYGGSIPTPRIDALAAKGARFTRAYAAAPVCTPSRAGLFSGLFPARLGVQANTGNNKVARKRALGLPSEVVLFPERLHTLGVRSGLIGKWHLGIKAEMGPMAQGFDEFFGFLGASHAYMPNAPDAKMLRGTEPEGEREQEYLTEAFARETEAFLARNKAQPFVLTVSFNAPHNPFQASDKYRARFPLLSGEEQTYAAMISALDDAVGRILDALEKEGLAEKTLVFFTSDNGAPLEESKGSNGELLEGKGMLFEGGNRVPLLLSWPQHTTPGAVLSAPVSLLDITATALAVSGVEAATLAELDGRDLAPLLAGAEVPERSLFWKLGPSAALVKGKWKLVTSKTSRWLFDLENDPDERFDLASSKAEVVATLGAELEAWVTKLPEPLWTNNEGTEPFRVRNKPYWVEY